MNNDSNLNLSDDNSEQVGKRRGLSLALQHAVRQHRVARIELARVCSGAIEEFVGNQLTPILTESGLDWDEFYYFSQLLHNEDECEMIATTH